MILSQFFLMTIFLQWVWWLWSQVLLIHDFDVIYIRLVELIFIYSFHNFQSRLLWRIICLCWFWCLLSTLLLSAEIDIYYSCSNKLIFINLFEQNHLYRLIFTIPFHDYLYVSWISQFWLNNFYQNYFE